MKRIYTIVISVILLYFVLALPTFAAEDKQTLNLGGGSEAIEYVSGTTTWAEAVQNSSTGTIYMTESGLICATGCVVVDEYEDPVLPSDVILSRKSYKRLDNSLLKCSIVSSSDYSSVIYSFSYFKGWTFYDYVNFAKENGNGTTKIDVTQGIAYYRTYCVNFPILASTTVQRGDYAISSLLAIDTASEDTISFHNETISTLTKQPTCTSEGERKITCKKCGISWTVSMATIDHTYSLTKNTATCTDPGVCIYTCSKCGGTKDEEVAALGHDWKEATCTTPKICKTCGDTDGEALGHDLNLFGTCKRDGCDYNCFIGDDSNDSNENTGVFDSVQNWFSSISTTLMTVFRIVMGALVIILLCIVGTYIVRFVRELSSARKKR